MTTRETRETILLNETAARRIINIFDGAWLVGDRGVACDCLEGGQNKSRYTLHRISHRTLRRMEIETILAAIDRNAEMA